MTSHLAGNKGLLRVALLIFCLILVFVGPILLAWWFLDSGQAKQALRNNHGLLISPPVDFNKSNPLAALKTIALRPGEWAVVYFTQDDCGKTCIDTQKNLDLIRSLLGRDAPRLQVWVLQGLGDPPDSGFSLVDKNLTINLSATLRARLVDWPSVSKTDGVVIFDWRSQLMMFYPDFKPGGLKKDLSKLLKASRIR